MIKHYYRRDKMIFWNDLLPNLLSSPDYQQPKSPTWVNPEPTWKYINPYSIHEPSIDREINQLEPNFRRIPQTTSSTPYGGYPFYEKTKTFEKNDFSPGIFVIDPPPPPPEVEDNVISTASSLTLTIVIFVGICFLLFNLCAFVGLYYQRDKLKVRERLANARYGCNLGTAEEEGTEEHYVKKEESTATVEAGRDLKNTEIKSILKSSEGIYEQIKASSGKSGTEGRKYGKWSGISRQASSSTVTIDPHTKVREWIAQEVVQRCSPRFIRKGKKLERKLDSTDTYIDQMSNNTVDSNVSKPGSSVSKMGVGMNTIQRQKVQKVSVAIDATPATRSASVLQQTPIELTKSLDEGKNSTGLGSMKTSTSLVTILKRPSLQRTDALISDESSEKLSINREPIRKSSSINLKLSNESIPTVVHFHSKSDPSEQKTSTSRLVNIHLTPNKSGSEVLYSQINKNNKKQNSLDNNLDVNVTSRDDLRSNNSHCSHEDTLDHIKRRNFPKVLPDLPNNGDEFHFNKTAKRRSLPLCAHLNSTSITDPGDYEDVDEEMQHYQTLKIPPAPPPRVSTLGRKPSNTSPVSPLSTSHLTVRLKGTELTNQKSQVPIPVKSPQVPILSSPIKPAISPVPKPESVQKPQKRIEPKVIIKPTITNPVTSRKDNKNNLNSNIPRVTHHVTPPSPKFGSSKDLSPKPPSQASKIPEMGMGKRTKITPVKKTVSTEAALDAPVILNTGTIKRVKK